MSNKLNDALILNQLDGQWQKFAAIILWKLNGNRQVRITAEDIDAFGQQFGAGGSPIIFTHGHKESIEFQIVSEEAAARIAAHDAKSRGTA